MGTRGKIPFAGFGRVEIAAAQSSLPATPVFVGFVDDLWNAGNAVPAEFDLEFTAAAACDLTNAELLGVVQNQIEIAADVVEVVTAGTDQLQLTSHGLLNGDGPIQFTTTDTLPAGLDLLIDYYVIYVDANNIKVATSLENAIEGTVVDITDAGTGTHTITGSVDGDPDNNASDFLEGTNNSYRIYWLSYGLLGQANDGAISLTATKGFSQRVNHRPRTVAYGVSATLSGTASIDAYPVRDVT